MKIRVFQIESGDRIFMVVITKLFRTTILHNVYYTGAIKLYKNKFDNFSIRETLELSSPVY